MSSQQHSSAALTPGKDPVPILREAGWTPRPVWTGGKSRPHQDSIPDRPARSQSLYRLSYPVHYMRLYMYVYIYARTDVCTMYVVCTYDYVHICTLCACVCVCVCVSATAKGLKLHVENQKSLSRELWCATQKREAAYITERVSLLFPFLPHHTRHPLKGIFSEL